MHAECADHQSQQLVRHEGFAGRAVTERQLSAGVPLPLVEATMIEQDRNVQMTCSQFAQKMNPHSRESHPGDRLRPMQSNGIAHQVKKQAQSPIGTASSEIRELRNIVVAVGRNLLLHLISYA
jgi:hypothetical protein